MNEKGTIQDNRKVSADYAFLENEDCTFHVDQPGKKVNWKFALFISNKDIPEIILNTEKPSENFVIPINVIDWREAKQFEIRGDSSVYFKGIVYLYVDTEKKFTFKFVKL